MFESWNSTNLQKSPISTKNLGNLGRRRPKRRRNLEANNMASHISFATY